MSGISNPECRQEVMLLADIHGKQAAVRFLTLGDSAVSVEFGDSISLAVNQRVMALQQVLAAKAADNELPGIRELVPTYCSLMVLYDSLVLDYDTLIARLEELTDDLQLPEEKNKTVVEIPVAYGGEYGPDLAEVAALHGMTEAEVIACHAAPEYPVYMLGFVAGFPYLGGMDSRLATPRRKTPRLKIAAGSVGIAGGQTGIYSVESPGGWQIIGRTPLQLYAADREQPILLSAGQYIKFKPILEADFKAMME